MPRSFVCHALVYGSPSRPVTDASWALWSSVTGIGSAGRHGQVDPAMLEANGASRIFGAKLDRQQGVSSDST
jgi:hypothetical protein